jgi:hypothetical protein
MKSVIGIVLSCILGWIFITFLFALYLQNQDYYGENPILRKRLEVKEPFKVNPSEQRDPMPDLASTMKSSPGDPKLNTPRAPYNLLDGWLSPVTCDQYPTAERCHDMDFQKRLEKTGTFRQLTNNYKRGDPNSCSAPIQDLVMNFYKVEPIP